MTETIKVVCVDDEVNVLKSLTRLFLDEDYAILTAESGEEGLALIEKEQPVQVVVSDYRMPGMNGVDFLRQVYERWPETIRIILSGFADTAVVVSAINEGQIYRFVPKPWNDDELKMTISKAVELYSLVRRNNELNTELLKANIELLRNTEQLEEKVLARTAELHFQNRVLRHSQVILDTLPVGVLGFDEERNLVQRNRFAENALKAVRGASLGAGAEEILPSAWFALLEKVSPGQVVSGCFLVDNMEFCVRVAMMDARDGQLGTVLVFEPSQCGDS